MIDIYQERIARYQEKICQNLTQIRGIFQDIPQEMRSSCVMEGFEEIMDKAKQIDENFDSVLSNIQNELDTKLENPSTELEETLHINGKTEITRL